MRKIQNKTMSQKIQIRSRALIVYEGKLLVVKHSEELNYYALPGGKMDEGENGEQCMIREIKEELGVEVVNPELKYVYRWVNREGVENLEFIFKISNGEDFMDLSNNERSHSFEIFELRWMGKGENVNLLPKDIKEEFDTNGFEFEGVKFI